MGRILIATLLGSAAVCASAAQPAHGQETMWARFGNHNARMTDLQPAWMAPLIQSDSRLGQALRFSVAQSRAPGERIISYGNNHGISLIGGTRWQLDLNPPAFFRNHSAAFPDGWGNASTQLKYRVASGNAEHGNFAVTAIFAEGFAPRAYQNLALTGYSVPKLAAGKVFGHFDVQTTLDGVLPSGKIDQQGRAIEWNVTGQVHATSRTWFDVEDNAAFFFGGPIDGKTQNFLTPAGFLLVKENGWGFRHPAAVIDGGMQIATSRFYLYNHSLITELRILF
ncbi:MAG: hypothetical protein WBW84_19550 [Acidobacteriaceae bacterium]